METYLNKVVLSLVKGNTLDYGPKVTSAEDVYRQFKALAGKPQEEVIALYLDNRNKIIAYYKISRGTVDRTLFSPADVLRPALLSNAKAIIMVHNHPSGDPTPSQEGKDITARISQAADVMGLILQHIIVGRGYSSLSEMGYLKNRRRL